MALPELAIVAEGDLSTGEHWVLRAGGTSADFYTLLETIHPDGHRDEGGMGGPPLPHGRLLSTYSGGSDRGLRRVIVRADSRVAQVRVQLAGDQVDLLPVAQLTGAGLSLFAALLPRTAYLVSVAARGADGQVLEPQDLSHHEAAWQQFQQRDNPPT